MKALNLSLMKTVILLTYLLILLLFKIHVQLLCQQFLMFTMFLKGVSSANKRYMKVKDQVKTLTPGVYNINLVGYSATDAALDLGDNTVLTIADTSGSATLQSAYQSAQGQINAYQPSNYTDYVEASNSSAIYLDMQSKFETVLDKIVTAPTERNIEDLTSKTQLTAKTSTTKASTGDPTQAIDRC